MAKSKRGLVVPKELNERPIEVVLKMSANALANVPIAGVFAPLLEPVIVKATENRDDRVNQVLTRTMAIMSIEKEALFHELANDEESRELFINCMQQAKDAISEERRLYIANLLAVGLSKKAMGNDLKRYYLKLLHSLNDPQIIILASHARHYMTTSEEFLQKHKDFLSTADTHVDSTFEEMTTAAAFKTYKSELVDSGLLEWNRDTRTVRHTSPSSAIEKQLTKALKPTTAKLTLMGFNFLISIGVLEADANYYQ